MPDHSRNATLYARLLGETWQAIPPPLRAMHDVRHAVTAKGLADVERGAGYLARIFAVLGGLPCAGRDVPLEVRMSATPQGERWERSFAGRRFVSRQSIHNTPGDAPLLAERVGPTTLLFQLTFEGERLTLVPRGWRCLGVPLPRSLMPVSAAYEQVDGEGRFAFFVEASHPWCGLIVRYRGWLMPAGPGEMDKISRS